MNSIIIWENTTIVAMFFDIDAKDAHKLVLAHNNTLLTSEKLWSFTISDCSALFAKAGK